MKLCGGELLCFDLKEMSEGQSRWLLPELFCVFWIADDDDIVSIFFFWEGGHVIREAMVLCWIQKKVRWEM